MLDADLRELRAFRRDIELREAGSWPRRMRRRVGRAARALRVCRAVLFQTRAAGLVVKRRNGVSLRRQLAEQWWLSVRHGLTPRDYYQYRLYTPGNRRRAPRYISQYHNLTLLYALGRDDELADKALFFPACEARALPAIPVLAEWRDGALVELSGNWPAEVYSKPALGFHGLDVRRWNVAAGERAELERFVGGHGAEMGAVVQPRIFNHPRLEAVSNGALCTIRVNTFIRPDGELELSLPILRMPVGDSHVDNFYQGNLVAPIDPVSGRLGMAALRDEHGVVWSHATHPDTGAPIEGWCLPLHAETMELCLRAQRAFVDCPLVGWDVAITDDGPLLVEGNDLFGSEAVQVAHDGPLGEPHYVESLLHHLRSSWRA